jgi:ABC-type branched-subunit amino acid transport system ATPase component/ABC-type branched-subunit amino acid transport system permease subunit
VKQMLADVLRFARPTRARVVLGLALIAAYLGPLVVGFRDHTLLQLDYVLSLLVLAVALNIAMGMAGQYLLGIGAVFSVGGYAAVLLADHFPTQVGLIAMCMVSVLAAVVAGLVLGLPALRVGGFYLALVSLFGAIAVPVVAGQMSFTGKETGISLVANPLYYPELGGFPLYAVVLTVLLAATLFSWALLHSNVGRRFVILHSSTQLAASLGIPAYRTQLSAIAISSAIAGLSGALYVYTQQFFSPGSADASLSTYILAGNTIGGAGTVAGPLLGGAIVLGLSQFLTAFGKYTAIVYALLLLVFVIFVPDGLVARMRPLLIRLGLVQPQRWQHQGGEEPPTSDTPGGARELAAANATQLNAGLVVEAARRSFGGVVAVDGVSLKVRRGTIHGLIGSNGSGKTTLLNLISGFYRLDSGHVFVDGVQVDGGAPHRAAQNRVGRTFQAPKLVPHASAIENVLPAAEISVGARSLSSILRLPAGRRRSRRAYWRAHAALARLTLQSVAHTRADALPHGTCRLIEVARVVAMDPSYVLLDEPAAGLSPQEVDTLAETMQSMAREGVGVLLIEHNVPLVLRLADDITVLHQGRLLFHGTPAELRANRDVARAFLGDDDEPLAAV